jgi:(2Fe-2S) ferredoxin
MIKQTHPEYRIFVCINEKPAPKVSCLKGEGEKVVLWMKEETKKRGLDKKLWITRTRCQGYCQPEGTALLFEPAHEQYSAVTFEDAQKLYEDFVKKI